MGVVGLSGGVTWVVMVMGRSCVGEGRGEIVMTCCGVVVMLLGRL